MQITIEKGNGRDRIAVRRMDGSEVFAQVPHKGPVPHDAVHYFVEAGLGFTRGFWGLVEAGHDPDDLAQFAKQSGHASAARCSVPAQDIVELLQAERLVECFEADMWSGTGDRWRWRSVAGKPPKWRPLSLNGPSWTLYAMHWPVLPWTG